MEIVLTGIDTLDKALTKVPTGNDSLKLAEKLGFWTSAIHNAEVKKPTFPKKISELTPSQLSDLYSEWTGEFGRIIELCGLIDSQLGVVKLQIKSAQTSARVAIRKASPEAKHTSTSLSDEADEDARVLALNEQFALLSMLDSYAKASKEATQQYLTSISREISFRDAQLKARIY
jgi:hypothetical protein